MEITLEQAMELIDKKAESEKQRMVRSLSGGIDILNGRYGPYLTFSGKNYRLPKALAADLDALTEEQCREVIDKADQRAASGRGRRKGKN